MNNTLTWSKESLNQESNSEICEVFDASKNNRVPSLAFKKLFEVKYSECYGDNNTIDELKNLAIFDILAYEMLTEKQLREIQKNINMSGKSFKEVLSGLSKKTEEQ